MSRNLETRLFHAQWSDGSIDLVAGSALVIDGMALQWDMAIVMAVVPPLALVGWMLLRSKVVAPLAGEAVPRSDRRARATRELAWVSIAGVSVLTAIAAIVAATTRQTVPATQWVDAVPAVLLALLAGAAALLTRSWRFAWYGAFLTTAGAVTVVAGLGAGLPLIVVGAVSVGIGALLLRRLATRSRSARGDHR